MSKPFFSFLQKTALQTESKNAHFWSFIGHFCSFLDLNFFDRVIIFLFFNMMFLGIFRSVLQKIVKKGSKFLRPFFGNFRSFSDLEYFLVNEFYDF